MNGARGVAEIVRFWPNSYEFGYGGGQTVALSRAGFSPPLGGLKSALPRP
jgi:hypothetical protein